MNLERWILIGVIFVSILTIITLIPRDRAREAWVLFFISSGYYLASWFVCSRNGMD
jgi:hypothetical protein